MPAGEMVSWGRGGLKKIDVFKIVEAEFVCHSKKVEATMVEKDEV